jgi:hypothetical protein
MIWLAGVIAIIVIVGSIIGWLKWQDKFLENWVPAIITGLFLVFLLPIINHYYWERQSEINQANLEHRDNLEKRRYDRSKRYELLSSTAETYTGLFKIHTRLNQVDRERSQVVQEIQKLIAQEKPNMSIIQIQLSRLTSLDDLRSDIQMERIKLESKVGSISAYINQYYSKELTNQYADLARAYDIRTSKVEPFIPTQEDSIVKGAYEMVQSMIEEVKNHEKK